MFVALLAFPASAGAQATGDVNVTLTPAVAKKASRLNVTASGQATNTGEQPPSAISLFVARGFKINPRAVPQLCTNREADGAACPETSRVATGSAQGQADVPIFGTFPFTGTIEAFLLPAQQEGDIAGVGIVVRGAGRQFARRGRLIPLEGPTPFGVELRFDNLNFGQSQAPPGSSVQLNRLELSVGASRVARVRVIKRVVVRRRGKRRRVRRRRTVRRRYNLITNPRTCGGSWPYQVKIGFPSGEQVRDGSVACSSR